LAHIRTPEVLFEIFAPRARRALGSMHCCYARALYYITLAARARLLLRSACCCQVIQQVPRPS
jgi:hypothetical protein